MNKAIKWIIKHARPHVALVPPDKKNNNEQQSMREIAEDTVERTEVGIKFKFKF